MVEKDNIVESDYCPVCGSCGEDGCCSIEKSLLNHGCEYSEIYAREAYLNKMIIDEFHKFFESLDFGRDETGNEVIDSIGDIYDKAFKRVDEKYKK